MRNLDLVIVLTAHVAAGALTWLLFKLGGTRDERGTDSRTYPSQTEADDADGTP